MNFKAKTYLNGTQIHTIVNEPVLVPSTDESIYLEHDFVSEILIYTGMDKTGTQITDFVANKDVTRSWMTYINFGSTARSTYQNTTVYINYKSEGDMVDSLMINRLEIEMERHQTEDPHNASSGLATQVASTSPIDGATNGGSSVTATMNKWIDDNQESKLKIYSDSARTIEVSGTVSKSGNKTLTWTPTASLSASTLYYPSVLSGLLGIDGVASTSTYNWSFQTASNQSPTLSVAVTGNTTLGSTLTATTTIGSDPEGDTVSSTTYEWLRNDVVISGATASTYVIAEADLGTTLKARATVDMSTGADPSPATSSGTAIPVHNPPSISVSAGNTQNTISFTQNSTLNTETYNLYWSTTSGVTKSNGTKITGVTSPHTHSTLTNGMTYYYVLTMVVNGVESADSAQVSGIPVENLAPVTSNIQTANISTSGFNVSGDITNIGASDFISKIQVAYIDESVDGVIATVGLDTAANSAVTAGRYFDITNSTDITNFQNHSTKYAKTGLTLTAGKTYVPAVRTEESDVA